MVSESNEPKFYSISVDGVTVISFTNNPNEIERVERFLRPNTEKVTFFGYKNAHGELIEEVEYKIQKEVPQVSNALSGVEVDARISEALRNARNEWDFEQHKKEHENTKAELKEAEKYIGELEKEISDLKGNRGKLGGVHIGEIAGVMLEGILRRNVDKLRQYPLGNALAGFLAETPQSQIPPQQPAQESQTSFEVVNETKTPTWWDDVEAEFTPEEVNIIKAIIAHLVDHREQINAVCEFLIGKK